MKQLHTFDVFYEWQGPTHSDPLAMQKTAEEIALALTRFPQEFKHRVLLLDSSADVSATPATPHSIAVTVSSVLNASQLSGPMTQTLQEWRLLARQRD